MTPRPETQAGTADDITAAVLAAKTARDTAVSEAEKKFWQRMGELSKSYRGAQKDVAAALNVERDAVYKNVRKYTDA
ncbi:hypothetical protein ABZX75_28385 [Streptomyces sp. NPDC003038]|uniref:hypothetical protein n=1 Tax=unclassified Streptomyces TaxID=2593676 RepID=UPI0033BE3F74